MASGVYIGSNTEEKTGAMVLLEVMEIVELEEMNRVEER